MDSTGTPVRTTVNMIVAIVFIIISDGVAVKATRRSSMCKDDMRPINNIFVSL